jgi:hypothetical protein
MMAVIIPYFPWIVNISAAHPSREYLPFGGLLIEKIEKISNNRTKALAFF